MSETAEDSKRCASDERHAPCRHDRRPRRYPASANLKVEYFPIFCLADCLPLLVTLYLKIYSIDFSEIWIVDSTLGL